MPYYISPTYKEILSGGDPVRHHYCDEQELLDIVNKLREAGGAEILEAFMPSQVCDVRHCLVANALNFGCGVRFYPRRRTIEESAKPRLMWRVIEITLPDGYGPWGMELLDSETAQMVANTMGWYYNLEHAPRHVALPTRVGNTAAAFDRSEGWTAKYAVGGDC